MQPIRTLRQTSLARISAFLFSAGYMLSILGCGDGPNIKSPPPKWVTLSSGKKIQLTESNIALPLVQRLYTAQRVEGRLVTRQAVFPEADGDTGNHSYQHYLWALDAPEGVVSEQNRPTLTTEDLITVLTEDAEHLRQTGFRSQDVQRTEAVIRLLRRSSQTEQETQVSIPAAEKSSLSGRNPISVTRVLHKLAEPVNGDASPGTTPSSRSSADMPVAQVDPLWSQDRDGAPAVRTLPVGTQATIIGDAENPFVAKDPKDKQAAAIPDKSDPSASGGRQSPVASIATTASAAPLYSQQTRSPLLVDQLVEVSDHLGHLAGWGIAGLPGVTSYPELEKRLLAEVHHLRSVGRFDEAKQIEARLPELVKRWGEQREQAGLVGMLAQHLAFDEQRRQALAESKSAPTAAPSNAQPGAPTEAGTPQPAEGSAPPPPSSSPQIQMEKQRLAEIQRQLAIYHDKLTELAQEQAKLSQHLSPEEARELFGPEKEEAKEQIKQLLVERVKLKTRPGGMPSARRAHEAKQEAALTMAENPETFLTFEVTLDDGSRFRWAGSRKQLDKYIQDQEKAAQTAANDKESARLKDLAGRLRDVLKKEDEKRVGAQMQMRFGGRGRVRGVEEEANDRAEDAHLGSMVAIMQQELKIREAEARAQYEIQMMRARIEALRQAAEVLRKDGLDAEAKPLQNQAEAMERQLRIDQEQHERAVREMQERLEQWRLAGSPPLRLPAPGRGDFSPKAAPQQILQELRELREEVRQVRGDVAALRKLVERKQSNEQQTEETVQEQVIPQRESGGAAIGVERKEEAKPDPAEPKKADPKDETRPNKNQGDSGFDNGIPKLEGEAGREIEQRLQHKGPIRRERLSLAELAQQIGKLADTNIVLDSDGLEAAGVDPDEKIFSLYQDDFTLADALVVLGPKNLAYFVEDDVLKITSAVKALEHYTHRGIALGDGAQLVLPGPMLLPNYVPAGSSLPQLSNNNVQHAPPASLMVTGPGVTTVTGPEGMTVTGPGVVVQADPRRGFPAMRVYPTLDANSLEQHLLTSRVTMHMTNSTLYKILMRIGAQVNVRIEMDNKSLEQVGTKLDERTFSIDVEKVPAADALKQLLDPLKLSYVVERGAVIIMTEAATKGKLLKLR